MGMSGAYAGPGTDQASACIATIHPALAEQVSRLEEIVAADGLRLSPEQPDRFNNLPVTGKPPQRGTSTAAARSPSSAGGTRLNADA